MNWRITQPWAADTAPQPWKRVNWRITQPWAADTAPQPDSATPTIVQYVHRLNHVRGLFESCWRQLEPHIRDLFWGLTQRDDRHSQQRDGVAFTDPLLRSLPPLFIYKVAKEHNHGLATHSAQCTVHSAQYAMHSMQCTTAAAIFLSGSSAAFSLRVICRRGSVGPARETRLPAETADPHRPLNNQHTEWWQRIPHTNDISFFVSPCT